MKNALAGVYVCALRSLFAARQQSKPKKAPEGFFRMFRLTDTVRVNPVQCMSQPDAGVSGSLCSSAKGPPGEGPAARAGPSPAQSAQDIIPFPNAKRLFP